MSRWKFDLAAMKPPLWAFFVVHRKKGNKDHLVLVDHADLGTALSSGPWYVLAPKHARGLYLQRNGVNKQPPKPASLHRLLVTPPAGVFVDHANGNGLDNRRCNLRLATNGLNKANTAKYRNNTSGFKGVYLIRDGRYRVKVGPLHVGYFADIHQAHAAYVTAAKSHYGEYSHAG